MTQYKIIGLGAKYPGPCVKCGSRTDEVLVKGEKYAVACVDCLSGGEPSIGKRRKAVEKKVGTTFEVA